MPETSTALNTAGSRIFVVKIIERDGVFAGSLRLIQHGREEPVRDLEGVSCEEVARSLAFVVAVLVDPSAAFRGNDPSERPPAVVASVQAQPSPRTVYPASPHWTTGLGIGLDFQSAVAPHAEWSPRISFVFAKMGSDHNTIGSGRLSLAHASSGTITGDNGDLTTYWTSGRIEGCGPRLGRALHVEACGWMEAGMLRGKGAGARETSDRDMLWLAPGGLLRVSFHPVNSLQIDAALGTFAPLVRSRFYIASADGSWLETLHEVPRWGMTGGVGIASLW